MNLILLARTLFASLSFEAVFVGIFPVNVALTNTTSEEWRHVIDVEKAPVTRVRFPSPKHNSAVGNTALMQTQTEPRSIKLHHILNNFSNIRVK